MTPDRPVQFGILGAGRISCNAMAPALKAAANAELVAVASRDPARAESLSPRRTYDEYLALLDDAEVEAVYIGTHNGLHKSLTLAALERGKHVLCEKPLACNAKEAAEMVDAAARHGRMLMEAFMYRYHPQVAELVGRVRAGAIGTLKTVEASFSFHHTDEQDVRYRADWGGGALLDLGCYCVNVCRLLFNGQPAAATAEGTFHPTCGVDLCVHGVLDFGDGRHGVISCGFDAGPRDHVYAVGTHGTLALTRAFASHRRSTVLIERKNGDSTETAFPAANLFQLEVEDFARAVRTGQPPLMPPDDGLLNARVLDALLYGARSGGTRFAVEA